MKRIFLAMAVLVAGACSLPAASEKNAGANPQRIQKHVEYLTKKLDLTNDQINFIQALLLQKHKRMEEVRKEMRLIRQQTDTEIKSLLTNEQKAKYEKMESRKSKEDLEDD